MKNINKIRKVSCVWTSLFTQLICVPIDYAPLIERTQISSKLCSASLQYSLVVLPRFGSSPLHNVTSNTHDSWGVQRHLVSMHQTSLVIPRNESCERSRTFHETLPCPSIVCYYVLQFSSWTPPLNSATLPPFILLQSSPAYTSDCEGWLIDKLV